MSALGQKQTCALQNVMSALHPIATAKAKFRESSCLLYPRKRKCAVQLGMSALGQKRTSASFDRFMMRPVSGTKRSKHVARCLTGNLHQAGKRLTHFQDQKNRTGYR